MLTFGNIEIEKKKKKFHRYKNPAFLNNLIISNKYLLVKEIINPLSVMLMNMKLNHSL